MRRYTVSLEKELSRLEAKRQRRDAQRAADETSSSDPAPVRPEGTDGAVVDFLCPQNNTIPESVSKREVNVEARSMGSEEDADRSDVPDSSASREGHLAGEMNTAEASCSHHKDPQTHTSLYGSSSSGSRFDILSTYRNIDRMVSSEAKKASARRRRTHENSIHSCCQGSLSSERMRETHESSASTGDRPTPAHAQSPHLPSSSSSSSCEDSYPHSKRNPPPHSHDNQKENAGQQEMGNVAQEGTKDARHGPCIQGGREAHPSSAGKHISIHHREKDGDGTSSSDFVIKSVRIPSKGPYKRLLPQPFSHVLVLDFEATCECAAIHFPHEIIEFPVVVLDTRTLQIVAEFHRYVRPTHQPTLSNFCTELTGITQEQVDASNTLDVVLKEFQVWLEEEVYPLCRAWKSRWTEACELALSQGGSPTDATKQFFPSAANEVLDASGLSRNIQKQKKQFVLNKNHIAASTSSSSNGSPVDSRTFEEEESMICFATDGPWDMRKFMFDCEVLMHHQSFPPLFYRFINVRNCFTQAFKCKPMKLTHMLRKLQMSFEGRRHSGIDDTRNILRVLAELLARGYRIHHVSTIQYRADSNAALKHDQAANELLKEYDGANSSGIGIARRQNNNNNNNNKNANGQKKKKK